MFTSSYGVFSGGYADDEVGAFQYKIQKLFTSVYQRQKESFKEYYEYFKGLLWRYPNHGLTEYTLITSFLYGLQPADYQRLNYEAGGSIEDLYIEDAWDLIDYVADGTRKYYYQESYHVPQEPKESNLETMLRKFMERTEQNFDRLEKSLDRVLEKTHELIEFLDQKEIDECANPESTAVLPKLHTAVPLEITENDQSTAAKNTLSTAILSDFKFKNSDFDPSFLSIVQVTVPNEPTLSKQRNWWCMARKVGTRVSNFQKNMRNAARRSKTYKKRPPNRLNKLPLIKASMKKTRHSTFGWKPGWRGFEREPSHMAKLKKNMMVRRFDLTHPWDPNL